MESQIDDLPETICERVDSKFPASDRADVLGKLSKYNSASPESGNTRILNAIIDQCQGNAAAIDPLIETAKKDWRNLFYSSRSDPYMLIGKLLKNLRFEKVFTDNELKTLKGSSGGIEYRDTFEAVLRTIRSSNKRITLDQHVRITQIGCLIGFPEHQFDWLMEFVREDERVESSRSSIRPWWKFW